jgi:hypothetical protein
MGSAFADTSGMVSWLLSCHGLERGDPTEGIDRLRVAPEAAALSSGGARALRDEVPAGWGLVAARKKERLPHDECHAT